MYDIIDSGQNKHQMVWDLGPRCNFDCTYCHSGMHDNHSPHASLEELKKTAKFIDEYYKLYSQFHKQPWQRTIVFTGGEPASNPDFVDLIKWIKQEYPDIKMSLTTNGTWDHRRLNDILECINFVTISYHTEGHPKLKEKVIKNILEMYKHKPENMRVNVMMHSGDENFKECQDLIANVLEPNGINFVPRIIGERLDKKKFVDTKKPERRKVHEYTPEQTKYIQSFWSKENKKKVKDPNSKILRKMGRMCCGKVDLNVRENGEWSTIKFLENTEFTGWRCLVNWYFLHIEQGNDVIYHHQTCRTNLDSEIGPIGTLSESHKIIDRLKEEMEMGGLPFIECPRPHCGCGICVPKAKEVDDAINLWNKYILEDLSPY